MRKETTRTERFILFETQLLIQFLRILVFHFQQTKSAFLNGDLLKFHPSVNRGDLPFDLYLFHSIVIHRHEHIGHVHVGERCLEPLDVERRSSKGKIDVPRLVRLVTGRLFVEIVRDFDRVVFEEYDGVHRFLPRRRTSRPKDSLSFFEETLRNWRVWFLPRLGEVSAGVVLSRDIHCPNREREIDLVSFVSSDFVCFQLFE